MPKLPEESYYLPKTGLGPRVTGGNQSKDTGKGNSRRRKVEKRAKAVPGPDAYGGHRTWKLNK